MITIRKRNISTALTFVLVPMVGGACGSLFGWRYGFHVFLSLIIGSAAGLVALALSAGIKIAVKRLFGSATGTHAETEALRAGLRRSMNQVHYQKRSGKYQNALRMIDLVIKLDPDYADALLLKAEILWVGFQNAKAARPLVGQVLMTTAKQEAVHQRALWLAVDMDDAAEPVSASVRVASKQSAHTEALAN